MKWNSKLVFILLTLSVVLALGMSVNFLRGEFNPVVSAQENSDTRKKVKSSQKINNLGEPINSPAISSGVSLPIRELPTSVPDAKSRAAKWVNPEELRERTIEQRRQELEDGDVNEGDRINERNEERVQQIIPGAGAGFGNFTDPLVSTKVERDKANLAPQAMPAPSLTFAGNGTVDNNAQGFGNFTPPDTNGDVGPNHYVQTINAVFSVYNKTGTRLTGPLKLSSLWSSVGGICSTNDNGDPIVLYDSLADRWMISQFAFSGDGTTPPYYQCVAVSKTGDPTGAYNVYTFQMPNTKFNDYPHFGVWSDAYYMTDNQFNSAGTLFQNTGAFAFDRSKMLIGDPTASYIYFDLENIDTGSGGTLPLDLDGKVAPPSTMPMLLSYFLADEFGNAIDGLRIFEFKPNFTTPASSTFVQNQDVALAAFDARQPNSRRLIEQSGGGATTHLDAIADRLMFRLAYRNLGTFQSPVNSITGNFTVNVSGVNPTAASTYQAGIRWFELRSTSTAPTNVTVFDQGTHNLTPNNGATGLNNWMGSIAQDRTGAIALGFSQSGTTKFADIMIAGRSTNTAIGTLNEGEALFFAAGGRQTSTANRWGDYSMMSVDPTDECTFWYTQEYYAATASAVFSTRIGKFKFPGCTAAAASGGTVTGTVTNCATGTPIKDALVTLMPIAISGTTNASGNYGPINAPAGTYTAQATAFGYTSGAGSSASVTVTDGLNTVSNLCLTGFPTATAGSATIVSENFTPANGKVDPGETVTVTLNVTNNGTAATTNAVGTLQATGGVTNPTPTSQNYGVIQPGQTVGRNFTFTAASATACGANIIASLQVQDGATNLGTLTYTFPTGSRSTVVTENFDSVVVPALPAGWTATNVVGAAPLWVTSNSGTPTPVADSAPNAAFVNDPAATADKALDTPSFTPAAGSQVSFRNNFSLESGFDGGVLEISINGGAFTDIVTAGGSFVSGGYNGTISSTDGSLIAGRNAWTGASGGFVTTTANLPSTPVGQPVKLRFRMVSDSTVAGVGWRIDNYQINGPLVCSKAAPTAADVSISGRVYARNGRGLANAIVTLTDSNGQARSIRTNSFGYYRFDNIGAGQTYVVQANAKRYRFASQVVSVSEDLTDINFTPDQ